MKKFVIVMIALLVLFVFLMLNYLLWDKENLQNQSATDKFDLDQLRSSNRTLQTTIDEQEQTINSLESTKSEYQTRIAELQQSLNQTTSAQENLQIQVNTKDQAVDFYKLLMADSLKQMTQQWFDSVNSQNYEGAYDVLDSDYTLFGAHYNHDEFGTNITGIKSISFDEKSGETAAEEVSGEKSEETPADVPAEPVFEVLQGRGSEYEIIAIAEVQVAITEEQKDTYKDMAEGPNRLQIAFRYNPDKKAWAIFSILEASE